MTSLELFRLFVLKNTKKNKKKSEQQQQTEEKLATSGYKCIAT